MKYFIIIIFFMMIAVQWFVPASMIYEQESVLKNGKEFKFKSAPVDPSDPFRGKYITLNFEADHFEVSDPLLWQPGDEVYVSIYDSAGHATIRSLSKTKPDDTDFINARMSYIIEEIAYINYPFDLFYLEEGKAPAAERLYNEMQRDTLVDVFAVVSVMNGVAALKDVTINGKSISEAAANYPK